MPWASPRSVSRPPSTSRPGSPAPGRPARTSRWVVPTAGSRAWRASCGERAAGALPGGHGHRARRSPPASVPGSGHRRRRGCWRTSSTAGVEPVRPARVVRGPEVERWAAGGQDAGGHRDPAGLRPPGGGGGDPGRRRQGRRARSVARRRTSWRVRTPAPSWPRHRSWACRSWTRTGFRRLLAGDDPPPADLASAEPQLGHDLAASMTVRRARSPSFAVERLRAAASRVPADVQPSPCPGRAAARRAGRRRACRYPGPGAIGR